MGADSPAPTQIKGEKQFGIRWDGEYEALSRLIFGLGTKFEEAATCPHGRRCVAARTPRGLVHEPTMRASASVAGTATWYTINRGGGQLAFPPTHGPFPLTPCSLYVLIAPLGSPA
jgi:hypothetical protein